MPEVVEHPPQPRRHRAPDVVIGHDLVIGPHAQLLHPSSEGGRIGEGMATGSARRGKVRVQVHEHGAGDVPDRIRLATATRGAQYPADVHDP
jgi:hypothetical protein